MVWNIPLTMDVEAIDYGNIRMFKVKKPKLLNNIFHNQKLWLSRIFFKCPSLLTLDIKNISKTPSFFGP